MQIAICDDTPMTIQKFINILENYLNKKDVDYKIDFFDNAADFRKSYIEGSYDIYFLDMFLLDVSGEELMLEIRYLYPNATIGCISHIRNQACIPQRTRSDVYICKLLPDEEILEKLDYLFERRNLLLKPFSFNLYDGGKIMLDINSIEYIKSTWNKISIHSTTGESYKLNTKYSIDTISDLKYFKNFCRISRNMLINIVNITDFKYPYIILKNGFEVKTTDKIYLGASKQYYGYHF